MFFLQLKSDFLALEQLGHVQVAQRYDHAEVFHLHNIDPYDKALSNEASFQVHTPASSGREW